MDLTLLKAYAISLLGTRYLFGTAKGGGDDPINGFDCSGFGCEWGRAAGLFPYNFRTSAQGLYETLIVNSPLHDEPELGDYVFFGKSFEQISHVGIALDDFTMVEAGGGDASTITDEIASLKNAFVRLRPIRYRKDYLGCVSPVYPKPKARG